MLDWKGTDARMIKCTLCPRQCHALRTDTIGEGFCGMGTLPVVARADAHAWEEPCISGSKGSGTIFFSGCTLGCVFCQNAPISHKRAGEIISVEALCDLFQKVEALGVHNLNLVNPTHFAPAILQALRMRKPSIPVIWNSSGYESVAMIEETKGLVDIFLPDCKFGCEETAMALAKAPNYLPITLDAISAMCKLTGDPVYDDQGIMQSGTMVRHLVLPMRTSESIHLLDALLKRIPITTPISLMRQYTPMEGVNIKGLDRRLTTREYVRVRDHMLSLGLTGYLQQKEAADKAYTPPFMDAHSVRLFHKEDDHGNDGI